jgi:type II secretion system protein N
MALRLLNLGPRSRKVVRYAGFTLLGLVTFVFAFQLAFPFGRVKQRLIDAMSDKYDVTIGDVERGFIPGRMYVKALTIRTRPAKADDVATTFYVEQLEVDLGILALLRGTIAIKLDAKIGPGHIKGAIALSKSNTSIDLTGDDLPSANLPVREAVGLPMSGKLRFSFTLELPNDKSKAGKVGPNWAKAEGALELACPSGCVIGDGKSKLKTQLKNARQQAMAEGGIEFGKVNIDTLFANVEIKNGKLDVTKFETKSGDGELHVDFDATLNQDILQSVVTGCLRFRGSDALTKREPKTASAISLTGAPRGPDNLFHIKLDGPLREVRRLGQVCGPTATGADNPGGPPARPNLTVTPELPPHPSDGIGIPRPTPPPPPPPPPVTMPEDAGVADVAAYPPVSPPAETPGGAVQPGAPSTGSQQEPQGPPGSAAPR